MSDELFRDTKRPTATCFIDSSKKCQFGGVGVGRCLQFVSYKRKLINKIKFVNKQTNK